VRLKTFGLPESAVNDRLAGIEERHGVVLAYRAHFPEIEVKVLARSADRASAERLSRIAADEVKSRLGDVVYAEGGITFAAAIGQLLREAKLTLGTAESCTGGLVAELLTEEGGASDYFRGAVVSYDNAVKTGVLGVSEALLAAHGAVSAEVARAMAEGGRRVLGADLALSLTGIAGPTGGTDAKPVGLVHFAVATAAGATCRSATFPGSRRQIRTLAAFAGLSLVRKVLREGHDPA
jgi:nicotinamide-nucleotide amidase